MARPRVFVSSTYYDLKHLRSSIEVFIESLGYEAILSEKGDIAYSPDLPLDESCYREVRNADVLVLVVGGRYGGERSGDKRPLPESFFQRYDSVTKLEYRAAVDQDIPIYILIGRAVYSEFQTFLRNRERTDIAYAHVESVNVFLLIEEILAQQRNNPLKEFDRYDDIESWLREQWAGLFRDLLHRASSQKQIATLQAQVESLSAIGKTLQAYLEEVVQKVAPTQAAALISREKTRLAKVEQSSEFLRNRFVTYLKRFGHSEDEIVNALSAASVGAFTETLDPPSSSHIGHMLFIDTAALHDANEARAILGLPPFPLEERQQILSRKGAAKEKTDTKKAEPRKPTRPPAGGSA